MRLPHGLVRFVSNRLESRQLALHADAARSQERLLGRILDGYRGTEIGRAMGIAGVRSVEAFRREVPMRGGDAYQPYWATALTENRPGTLHRKRLKYVAVSSGSTGAQKAVPVPAELLASYRRFTNHLFFHAFRELGRYDIFDGHVLVAAGPAVKEVAESGVLVGFGSGIASVESPRFARSIVKPSAEVQQLRERDAKLAAIADEAMSLDVRACSGIPTSAIAMFERVLAEARARGKSAGSMRELFPNLALYGYSGTSIAPYRARLRELLGEGVPTYEVYSSTESPIAFQYRLGEPGMIVDLSCVVLELVPADSPEAPRIGLADAEIGREYIVAITSPGGTFAYALGDRIRVLSTAPYLIEFARRGTDEINYAGEKLELALLRDALRTVLAEDGVDLGPFVVMPTERVAGAAAGYELVIEHPAGPLDLAARIDARLRSTQYNYSAMRANDSGIGAPVVRTLPRGTLETFLHREKVFGHAKLPEVQLDRSALPGILEAAAKLLEGRTP